MEMIDQHGVEHPVSTQLWGNDPAIMAQAAALVRECGADIVDINFGCPAPKVTKTEGGSACLRDVDRCEAIMRAVVEAVDCPVTMKMRLGWNETDLVYIEVARRAQAVGVKAVTLHARTAKQFYKGEADWAHIAALKRAIDIPVIGNGDLSDARDAFARMRASGVDGVMLGRATLGNPWLVGQLRALMEGREPERDAGRPGAAALRGAALPRDGRGVGRSARGAADAQAPRLLSQRLSRRERAARAADAHRDRGRDAAHRRRDDRSRSKRRRANSPLHRDRRARQRRHSTTEAYENYREYRQPAARAGDEALGQPGRGDGARRDDRRPQRQGVSRFRRRLRRVHARVTGIRASSPRCTRSST